MASGTFGERLKREREIARSLAQGSHLTVLRIGPRFLEALENEEWEKLPRRQFSTGVLCAPSRAIWASMKRIC